MSMASDTEEAVGPGQGLVLSDTLITGVAGYYYHAAAPVIPGEPVYLIREPANAADANAVAICDVRDAFPRAPDRPGAFVSGERSSDLPGRASQGHWRSRPMAADRHLLLGLIALQTGLIDQDQLIAAFRAWARDKGRPLADHLV